LRWGFRSTSRAATDRRGGPREVSILAVYVYVYRCAEYEYG